MRHFVIPPALFASSVLLATCLPAFPFKNFCRNDAVSYSLTLKDESKDGWNCRHALTNRITESGFRMSMDMGSGGAGHIAVYGHGTEQAAGQPIDRKIHLGIIQLPGKTDRWLCATDGTLNRKDKKDEIRFKKVQPVLFPIEGSFSNNTLEIRRNSFRLMVDGKEFSSNEFLGYGCDPGRSICSFEYGSETAPYRVIIRSTGESIAPVYSALIILENGRSPGSMRFTQVFNAGTIKYGSGSDADIQLSNIPPLRECPFAGESGGELLLKWPSP